MTAEKPRESGRHAFLRFGLSGVVFTIAAPVAEAFGDHLQLLIAHHVHRAAFPHGDVVGWVEVLGADVAPPGAGPADHAIGALIEARAVLAEGQLLLAC